MPIPTPFPLEIIEKVNSPELQAWFAQFGYSGYLSSDEINKILLALAYLNENIGGLNNLKLQGKYNAALNGPALNNATGSFGDCYEVTIGGTQDYGDGFMVVLADGDHVFKNIDGKWRKFVDNNQTFDNSGNLEADLQNVKLTTAQTISGVKTFLSGMFGFRNIADTFTSFLSNANTASRTYLFQNKSGTVAHLDDITASATTYFVNLTTGNDATAAIGNRNLPYQTLTAVLTSINSSLTDNFHIIFQVAGTYSSTVVIPIKNITFWGTGTDNTTEITFTGFGTNANISAINSNNVFNILTFNNLRLTLGGSTALANRRATLFFNNASVTRSSTHTTGTPQIIQCLNIYGTLNTVSATVTGPIFYVTGTSSNVIIQNFIGSVDISLFVGCSSVQCTIKNISGYGNLFLANSCLNRCYFKIEGITMINGSLLLNSQCDNSNIFEFINTSIPAAVTVNWGHQGIITGYMSRFSPNGISSPFGGSGAIAQFINFTGRLNNILLISNLNIPHYFINCNIITSGNLLSTYLHTSTPFTAGTKIFFIGHNTFIQDTDVPLINATATPIQIERQGANSIQSNRATLASGTVTVVNIPLNQL